MSPEQVAAIAILATWTGGLVTYLTARLRLRLRRPVDLDSVLVLTDGRKQPTRAEIERDLMRDPAEWVREAEEAVERENR